MKVPNLGDAHCGEGAEQSIQVVFPGRFCKVASYESINQEGLTLVGGEGAPWSWSRDRLPTYFRRCMGNWDGDEGLLNRSHV